MHTKILDTLIQQDTRLDATDKQALSSFFQEFMHSEKRSEIHQKKVHYQWYIIAAIVGLVLVTVIRLLLGTSMDIAGINLGEVVFFGIAGVGLLIGYYNKKLASGFGPDFVQTLFGQDIEYSKQDIYFAHLQEYKDESGLLKGKIQHEAKEDSIQIQKPSYTLQAMEYLTYNKSKNEKNSSISNHAYIIRLKIHDHRFPIRKRVVIQSDVNTSGIRKYITYIGMTVLLGLGGLLVSTIIAISTQIPRSSAMFVGTICGAVIGFLLAHRWEQSRMKKYVQLESIQFEKYFDVMSDDPIESRKLLTPSMMENLVGLRKTGKKRELSFIEDTVYAKFDIQGSFLEVNFLFNSNKKVYKAITDFYLAIRYMQSFAEYLNVEYFSATTRKSNVDSLEMSDSA